MHPKAIRKKLRSQINGLSGLLISFEDYGNLSLNLPCGLSVNFALKFSHTLEFFVIATKQSTAHMA